MTGRSDSQPLSRVVFLLRLPELYVQPDFYSTQMTDALAQSVHSELWSYRLEVVGTSHLAHAHQHAGLHEVLQTLFIFF